MKDRTHQLDDLLRLVKNAIHAENGEAWRRAKTAAPEPFVSIERLVGRIPARGRRRHFAVLGPHAGKQIDCTWAESGAKPSYPGVPGVTFRRTAAKNCSFCCMVENLDHGGTA